MSALHTKNTSVGVVLILAVAMFALNGSFAAEGSAPPEPARNPIVIYTQDASARTGPLIARLAQIAREPGGVRVIVGLQITMLPRNTLQPDAAASQAQVLRALQDSVTMRVLGRTSGQDIIRYESFPYVSIAVDAEELAKLVADPQVVSVYEDVPVPARVQPSPPSRKP